MSAIFKKNFDSKCFIEDEFSISEIIPTEKAAGDLELLEIKEDQALQMLNRASFL